jgi:hypothetical protein
MNKKSKKSFWEKLVNPSTDKKAYADTNQGKKKKSYSREDWQSKFRKGFTGK